MKVQAIHLRIGRISADSSQRAALRDGALAQSIEAELARHVALPSGYSRAGMRDRSHDSLASMIAGNIADKLAADGMVPNSAARRRP